MDAAGVLLNYIDGKWSRSNAAASIEAPNPGNK